ncbi:MAG: primosomal protein N' (replication factor Y) - superfamily II helicase [Acidobacteriota bacterium]
MAEEPAARTPPEPEQAAVHRFPCKQCGADVEYAPGEGLKCPFCGYLQGEPENAAAIQEYDFDSYMKHQKTGYCAEKAQEIHCKSCGATSTVSGDTASAACAFCGAPVVMKEPSEDVIRPEGVVPFKVDKREVAKRFRLWVSKLWFAPNALRSAVQEDRIQGVYRPYWTYDSATRSWYEGQRGEYYYETEHYTDSQGKRQTRQVRKTRWYPASGQVRKFFDDVLVSAGRPLEWTSDYVLTELKPYDPGYLAGWQAERYTTTVKDGWTRAKEIIDGHVRELVRSDIGGDEQRISRVDTSYDAIRFKHVLLPLYLSSYAFFGKTYRFQANGQTGEIRGQRPYSFWKIFFFVMALLFAFLGFIAFLHFAGGK